MSGIRERFDQLDKADLANLGGRLRDLQKRLEEAEKSQPVGTDLQKLARDLLPEIERIQRRKR